MKIPENFDRWMFDYLEGNLSPVEVKEFEQFLAQNPDFEADADAWQNAIVEAESVEYPNIHTLERKRKFAGWYSWSAAAIAILLITSGGFYLMNTDQSKNSTLIDFSTKSDHQSDYTTLPNTVDHKSSFNQSNQTNQSGSGLNSPNFTSWSPSYNASGGTNSGFYRSEDYRNNFLNVGQAEPKSTENGENNTTNKSLEQEKAKLAAGEHASQYQSNPGETQTEINLTKINRINYHSLSAVVKRGYRKIEKLFGYPVGVVNLRDPELLTPEDGILASNPGFVGSMLRPRFEARYRNQWLGTDMNVQKSQFSFDNYVPALRGGFGFSLNSAIYNNGAFADHSIDFMYSPKIVLTKKIVFEPAIKVTLGLLSGSTAKIGTNQNVEIDRGLLVTNSFETVSTQTDQLWYKDYGVGFVLNGEKFYFGLSADNLNRHYANVYRSEEQVEPVKTPVLLNGIIGYDYVSKTKPFSLSPFISGRQYGELLEGWGGLTARLNHFTFGASYSTSNNYALAIGLKYDNFKLTYQYDKTMTLFTQQQVGSHTLGIRFTGRAKKSQFK